MILKLNSYVQSKLTSPACYLTKTKHFCAHTLLRHVSTHLRLFGLTCPTQGFTTYLVPIIYFTVAY